MDSFPREEASLAEGFRMDYKGNQTISIRNDHMREAGGGAGGGAGKGIVFLILLIFLIF